MPLILFLLVLSVLVLIHEAGHYLTARLFGVKADEFGYGFPPRLIGFVKDGKGTWKKIGRTDNGKYRNTIWSINWLPLGGFVRIKGEQPGEEHGADSFHNKPIWQRVVILAAGVTMNWILAFLLFTVVFMSGTLAVLEDLPSGAVIKDRSIRITQVLPGSPAERGGLKINDVVISINGVAPRTFENAREIIFDQGEQTFPFVVEREHERTTLTVTPAFVKEANRVALGIGLADVGRVSFSPATAAKAAALATFGYTKAILATFGDLLKDLFAWRAPSQDLSGPVGIAVLTGQIAQQGFIPLLQFAAVLSINLAVINFLPIPALDGGRVMFLVIEKLRRRAMSRRLEAGIHNAAFLILITLILVITVRDVSKYGGVIVGGLKGLVGM